jgi:hypothetical protein
VLIGAAVLFVLMAVRTAAAQDRTPAATTVLSPQEKQRWRTEADQQVSAGDLKGSLNTLNLIGEPIVGSVKVEGLVRGDSEAVGEYLALQPGALFTAERLLRLERRLDELPIASKSTVGYQARAGSAVVTPVVSERDRVPTGVMTWMSVGARAAFTREVRVNFSDLAGWGEVWTPAVRVDPDRMRALLHLSVPAPGRIPGVLHLETFTERQRYQGDAINGFYQEYRFRAGGALSDWVTSWLRLEGGPAYERIAGTNYFAFGGNVTVRTWEDRLAFILTGERWNAQAPVSPLVLASLPELSFSRKVGGRAFGSTEFVTAIRSTADAETPSVSWLAGVSRVGDGAPLALWPAATSSQTRGVLLRAHDFDRRDLSEEEMIGRRLWFTTVEYEHPIHVAFGTLAVAGFVDSARAFSRPDGSTSKVQIDIGAGVRVATSKSAGGRVRLDFGYGLRDGGMQLSAGYVVPWGTR